MLVLFSDWCGAIDLEVTASTTQLILVNPGFFHCHNSYWIHQITYSSDDFYFAPKHFGQWSRVVTSIHRQFWVQNQELSSSCPFISDVTCRYFRLTQSQMSEVKSKSWSVSKSKCPTKLHLSLFWNTNNGKIDKPFIHGFYYLTFFCFFLL